MNHAARIHRLALGVVCTLLIVAAGTEAQERPPGWKPEGPAGSPGENLPPAASELPPAEAKRYTAAALRLVEALNARDAESYRRLFTDRGWSDSIDWWRDMFAAQYEAFGAIATVYPPRRGVIRAGGVGIGSDDIGGATFLVLFEEPAGGALTFRLDDEGRIDATNVFIQRGMGASRPEGMEPIYPRPESAASGD